MRRLGDESLEVAQIEGAVRSEDGRQVVFARALRGCHELASILPDGSGLATLLAGERQFGVFSGTGDKLVFSAEHPTLPSELYAVGADGTDVRQLSDLNGWWKDRTPLQAERRTFGSPMAAAGRRTSRIG